MLIKYIFAKQIAFILIWKLCIPSCFESQLFEMSSCSHISSSKNAHHIKTKNGKKRRLNGGTATVMVLWNSICYRFKSKFACSYIQIKAEALRAFRSRASFHQNYKKYMKSASFSHFLIQNSSISFLFLHPANHFQFLLLIVACFPSRSASVFGSSSVRG